MAYPTPPDLCSSSRGILTAGRQNVTSYGSGAFTRLQPRPTPIPFPIVSLGFPRFPKGYLRFVWYIQKVLLHHCNRLWSFVDSVFVDDHSKNSRGLARTVQV